ncbi:MBOAT family O-acyltransferase [Bosea sp. 2RAB26]|uniref:MBOAT family O-acyltransferase n=1 Tax=Bosea sp. 2RAB26 TaxID=3237476 RepID=UPI003F926A52
MLFQSQEFLGQFLPVTLIAFLIVAFLYWHTRNNLFRWIAGLWLILCSVYFYAKHNPEHAVLLAALMLANYALGEAIARHTGGRRRLSFVAGLVLNVGALAWFKYAQFIVSNIEAAFSITLAFSAPVLPLAISFFTFQKIAYLADRFSGRVGRVHIPEFILFVVFFPQLIAGPIVHFREVGRQFLSKFWLDRAIVGFHVGVVVFSIGLAKKTVIADTIAQASDPIFRFAHGGGVIDLLRGWHAALGYTAQLYFDFSGYSDMAIGLGLMLGIRLPINFRSPYKAPSIIDFWRRWHITLSRFLTDYLYIPLGGNRRGMSRRFLNLMIVMLLGGLWHGAQWTFVAWGALHGFYLIVNHAWRYARGPLPASWLERAAGWLLTFLAVVVAWVLFKSDDFQTAQRVFLGMMGANGLIDFQSYSQQAVMNLAGQAEVYLLDSIVALVIVIAALCLAFFTPTTLELVGYKEPSHDQAAEGDTLGAMDNQEKVPPVSWTVALLAGVSLGAALWTVAAGRPSEFIYFRF